MTRLLSGRAFVWRSRPFDLLLRLPVQSLEKDQRGSRGAYCGNIFHLFSCALARRISPAVSPPTGLCKLPSR
jgi:hypothetical protein